MGKKVIICVDDERMVLSSIKEQLKNNFKDQYLYETADNASDTLELVDELAKKGIEIILIVSDWLMPGIKGDELLIKIHQKHPKIVMIMLTGHADEKAVENAKINANLFACIHKPWDEKTLVNAICKAMELR